MPTTETTDPTAVGVARSDAELRAAIDVALAQPTLCGAFQASVRAGGERPALRTHGDDDAISWADYGRRVEAIAGGLHAIGVRPDACVALLLRNVPAFNLVDTAALHLGAVPFSLYPTDPLEQMAALVEDAGARVLVTEASSLRRAIDVAARVADVEHVVVVDGAAGDAGVIAAPDAPGVIALEDLERRRDPGFDFDASWRAVTPESLVTLVYTSGTTGEPKGVQLAHRAIVASLRGVEAHVPATPAGRGLSFLPAAHITDRFICHYSLLALGGTLTCVPDPDGLFDAIAETRPTRFFGVPRTWEKLADRARAAIAGDPEREAALALRLEQVRAEQRDGVARGPERDEPLRALAPIRAALGLDAAEWLAVAAAPSSYDTLETHHALGFELAELWGMSEFIMAIMNPPGRIRLGAVGIPLPQVEARLADDGELLLRGPHACSGYRNDPGKTAAMAAGDGWIRSGDVAAVDERGYYRIVGRKKEQMINSSGKNLFPAKIEGAIADGSPLIAYVASIGDRRRYVAALIVLDQDELRAFADRHGLEGDHAALSQEPSVLAEIERAVAVGNAHLARVEQVRSWAVLDVAWRPGTPEVTNTMKLRRKVIAERYAADIEALYA